MLNIDHIDRPCPGCGKRELHWSKRQICCLSCECDWSIEDLLEELEIANSALRTTLRTAKDPRA